MLICMLAVCACEDPPPPVTMHPVPVKGLYSVDLPSNLLPGSDMHPFASLQYYDVSRHLYVLGIEDAKQNLGDIKRKRLRLAGYYDFVESVVFEKFDTLARVAYQIVPLRSGLRVKAGDYYTQSKQLGGTDLFYRIAVYESREYFLQLVIWTFFEHHCEQMPYIDSITYSLRLIDSSQVMPPQSLESTQARN
jgi:hypothetical protein